MVTTGFPALRFWRDLDVDETGITKPAGKLISRCNAGHTPAEKRDIGL